ncbi:MAG: hypothetical protein JSU82_13055 [Rhodospirillales bacterium]|nr:MAG: hypothetical protein JSU82_13055 [Rhodospirillales bacterium]
MAIFVGVLPHRAEAGDLGAFNDAFADAYRPYRQAVFYARTGNIAVAALELDSFLAEWSGLASRFAANPPDAFSDDGQWADTLDAIAAAGRAGLEHLDAGDSEGAGRALAPIRQMASELRRRNGVTTYSDDVDELSAAMDVLARYRREVKDLGDADVVAKVAKQAAIVEYLFGKCEERAPRSVATDPEFRRLVDGARESMDKLWTSLKSGDMRLYRIGIGEVHSYERILFLRFG